MVFEIFARVIKDILLIRRVLLLFLLLITTSSNANDSKTIVRYLTGQTYLQEIPEYRNMYVTGVFDQLVIHGIGNEKVGKVVHCSTKRIKNSHQLRAVVDKYIEDNPEEWNISAALLTFTALAKMCGELKSAK